MGFRNWMTKKVTNLVQDAVVEPVKKDVAATADGVSEKIGLVTNVIRFLFCAVIGAVMLRDAHETGTQSRQNTLPPAEPTHITINNYIHEGGQHGHDDKPHED